MIATPDEQRTYLAELEYTPHPHTKILTEEEQADCREEIDYAVSMHGYEYVWGYETPADKAKDLIRNAPGMIADGLSRLASNPTVIAMNEKAKAMNARLCEEEAMRAQQADEQRGRDAYARNTRRKPPFGGGGLGGLGGGINLDFGDDHL